MKTLWLLPADERFRVLRGAKAHADGWDGKGRVALCGRRPTATRYWKLYSIRSTRRCCGVCLRLLSARGRR